MLVRVATLLLAATGTLAHIPEMLSSTAFDRRGLGRIPGQATPNPAGVADYLATLPTHSPVPRDVARIPEQATAIPGASSHDNDHATATSLRRALRTPVPRGIAHIPEHLTDSFDTTGVSDYLATLPTHSPVPRNVASFYETVSTDAIDATPCDKLCMSRFWYQTAFSAVQQGVEDAMRTYHIIDWCNSTAQEDFCPDLVLLTMTAIAAQTAANVSVEFDGRTTKVDLVLRLSRLVSLGRAEGTKWILQGVAEQGVLAAGVPQGFEPNATVVLGLHYVVEQGANATAPTLDMTAFQCINVTGATTAMNGTAPSINDADSVVTSTAYVVSMPPGVTETSVVSAQPSAPAHGKHGRHMGLGLGLGLGVPLALAPLALYAADPQTLYAARCSDPVLCAAENFPKLEKFLEAAQTALDKQDSLHRLLHPRRWNDDPQAPRKWKGFDQAEQPHPWQHPEIQAPRALHDGEAFQTEMMNKRTGRLEMRTLQYMGQEAEAAFNRGDCNGQEMVRKGYRGFTTLDKNGRSMRWGKEALQKIYVGHRRISWQRPQDLRPLEGVNSRQVGNQRVLTDEAGRGLSSSMGDPIVAAPPPVPDAPPIAMTPVFEMSGALNGPVDYSLLDADGDFVCDADGEKTRLTFDPNTNEVSPAKPKEHETLPEPTHHESPTAAGPTQASATMKQHTATPEVLSSAPQDHTSAQSNANSYGTTASALPSIAEPTTVYSPTTVYASATSRNDAANSSSEPLLSGTHVTGSITSVLGNLFTQTARAHTTSSTWPLRCATRATTFSPYPKPKHTEFVNPIATSAPRMPYRCSDQWQMDHPLKCGLGPHEGECRRPEWCEQYDLPPCLDDFGHLITTTSAESTTTVEAYPYPSNHKSKKHKKPKHSSTSSPYLETIYPGSMPTGIVA